MKSAKAFGAFASGGEHRALRIADAVLADIGGLDGVAFDGFLAFANIAYDNPNAAYLLIKPVPLARQTCNEQACDAAIDPLTVTPPPTSPRLEANLANIPPKPSADELAEIADEEQRQEIGGRLL